MTVGATAAPGVAEAGGTQVATAAPLAPAACGVGVAGRTGGPAFRFLWRRRALR